jgi:hypothetical protein
MTFDGRTYGLGDDQTYARATGRLAAAPPSHVNNDVGLHGAHPVLHRCVKFSGPPHAVACRKHRQRTRRSDQADNARRPLRRRLDTIERPARVRIRSRKPCTRARRRLFGWKVRLPLATAFSSLCRAQKYLSHPTSSHFATTSVGSGLAAGRRGPQSTSSWVAAVSPTFGRLFEGTDEPSPGQTWPGPTDPLKHCVNVRCRQNQPAWSPM